MTLKETSEKLNWFLFLIGYFIFGYLTINWISSQRVFFYDVSTSFDSQIPFMPIFIFGYIIVYLAILLIYLTIKDMSDWHRAVVSFFIATTLTYVFFLVFPVHMNLRPDLSSATGVSLIVTKYYYLIDLPYNCFPSLHVTYPTLATLVAWRNHKIMRWVFLLMAIIVAVSVVLVKQHYLADVAAGFINACLCFYMTIRLENVWKRFPIFKPSNVQP